MDYPPDWMLTDVEDRKKQDVDAKYLDALARYYLRYLQEYERNGVVIDYLSPFNEPGIYTKIPFAKIRDLVRDHLGPLLQKAGVKTRLMTPESFNRDDAAKNQPVLLDDAGARRFIAVLAYHGYGFRQYGKIAALHERYPDLPVWMTEVCHAYQAGTPRRMVLPRLDFEDGAFWGDQIVSDLESGASAWIYWNMILDEKGGPWLVSPVHGNPDPNVQHPVVVVNRDEKKVVYTGLYYYLAHFSRFVRPGAVRVKTEGGAEGIRAVAFRGPDGRRVAEVLNARKEAARVRLDWRGRSVALDLPPVSIATCVWE
jgi:glucosylceramidase